MKSPRLLLPLVSLLVAMLASTANSAPGRRGNAATPPGPQAAYNLNPAPSAPPAVAATTTHSNRSFGGNNSSNGGAPTKSFTPNTTVNRNFNPNNGSNNRSFQATTPRTTAQNPVLDKGTWNGNRNADRTVDNNWSQRSKTPFTPSKPVFQPEKPVIQPPTQKQWNGQGDRGGSFDKGQQFNGNRGGNFDKGQQFSNDRGANRIPFVQAQQPVFRGGNDGRFSSNQGWDRSRDWNRERGDWDRSHGWRPLPHNDAWLYLSFGSHQWNYSIPSGLPPMGSVIIGADNSFLGVIDVNRDNPDSISNPYGRFGSPESPYSIWNQDNEWGAGQSPASPWNPYATQPPMIYFGNQFRGYLTTNPQISPRVDPNVLMSRLGIEPQ